MTRPSHQMSSEGGTVLIVVAGSLIMLMGIAAIAVDLGVGFNERRQDQTAADTAAMSGAVEFALGSHQDDIVSETLALARSNLDTTYSNADWQAMWETCTDPGRVNFDLGNGSTATFQPVDSPWTAGTKLDCISTGSSYIRVRIPDQAITTTFGRVVGVDKIETNAAAVAHLNSEDDYMGLLPFGIPGGSANGELCLKTSGSGTAYDPCQGPSGGGFGEIDSEFFGDFFGAPDCGNPGHPELRQNVAIGLDHFVAVWPAEDAAAEGVTTGSAHPGSIASYQNVSYDACSFSGGSVVPEAAGQTFPANSLLVATGFSPEPIEVGLISDQTFLGETSRLWDGSGRPLVKKRTGVNNTVYKLDNVGPWQYLTGSGLCDKDSYAGRSTAEKVERFDDCLRTYGGTSDIFDDSIGSSPRFAWAPEYWHAASTSGSRWQPVRRYRMMFLGGLWFNCNASGICDIYFYPDSEESGELCAVSGGGCSELSLSQVSGWLLPDEAVPDEVRNAFPGGQTPFEPTLFR